MGDLQPVIEAILKDAKIRAAAILEDAESRINTMHTELLKEKTDARERFLKELDSETEQIYEKERMRDRQLLKNACLKAKTDSIKEVIVAAKEEICKMSDADYCDVVSGIYKSIGVKGGTVYLNERDKKRVKKSAFQGARIADECILTDGGFRLVFEGISYDCTIESIFEEKYSEICDRINAIYRKEQ